MTLNGLVVWNEALRQLWLSPSSSPPAAEQSLSEYMPPARCSLHSHVHSRPERKCVQPHHFFRLRLLQPCSAGGAGEWLMQPRVTFFTRNPKFVVLAMSTPSGGHLSHRSTDSRQPHEEGNVTNVYTLNIFVFVVQVISAQGIISTN